MKKIRKICRERAEEIEKNADGDVSAPDSASKAEEEARAGRGFGQKEEKQAKQDKKAKMPTRSRLTKLEDRVKRQLAEFENFREQYGKRKEQPCLMRVRRASLKRCFRLWTILKEDWRRCRRRIKKMPLWTE